MSVKGFLVSISQRKRSWNMVFQRDGGLLLFYSRGRSWWMVSANCFEELFDLFLLLNKCINVWVLYVFFSIHQIVSKEISCIRKSVFPKVFLWKKGHFKHHCTLGKPATSRFILMQVSVVRLYQAPWMGCTLHWTKEVAKIKNKKKPMTKLDRGWWKAQVEASMFHSYQFGLFLKGFPRFEQFFF